MDGEVAGPCVVVLIGPEPGRALRLEERAVELGRGETNDLVIEQASVAHHHARLELREKDWVIIDRSDGAGLRVNDLEVREHRLDHGDHIGLGEVVLVFGNRQQRLRAWLTTPTNVEEHDELMSSSSLRRQWHDLKASMQPGDELWCFCSPRESWQRLSGRSGLCVVHEGAVIYTIVTEMN